MKLRILTVGKKHEPWVEQGVDQFVQRLRPPFSAEFELIPHSGKNGEQAAEEESAHLLRRIRPNDHILLLDERGTNLSSPELSAHITDQQSTQVVIIIGGAYGVSQELRQRANLTWSLSRLVFPHQLVRLILAEQLYRAQEISRGSQYHHK